MKYKILDLNCFACIVLFLFGNRVWAADSGAQGLFLTLCSGVIAGDAKEYYAMLGI